MSIADTEATFPSAIKNTLCFLFNSEKGCTRGSNCRYVHEKGPVPTSDELAANKRARRKFFNIKRTNT